MYFFRGEVCTVWVDGKAVVNFEASDLQIGQPKALPLRTPHVPVAAAHCKINGDNTSQ